jgi:hypothetical protein
MPDYIDWGNCSPDKIALKKKQEEQDALFEQAKRVKMLSSNKRNPIIERKVKERVFLKLWD